MVPCIGSNGSSATTNTISKVCLHNNILMSHIIQHLLIGKVGQELESQMPGVMVQGSISQMPSLHSDAREGHNA